MDGFQKIELKSPSLKKEQPGERTGRKRLRFSRKTLLIIVSIIAFFGVLSVFFILLPAKNVYSSAMKTKMQAKKALDAIKNQNIELADTELKETKKDLAQTQKELNSLSYLKYVPIASGYYNDAEHLMNAGNDGLEIAGIVVDSVKPYADLLGLKGQGSFTGGSAEQRIQTAILTMGKVTPRIDDVAKYALEAKKEIDEVNPNHYPSFLGGNKIKNQLTQLKSITDQSVDFIDQARPLIKILPGLLGESKDKKYLVLFQNDKELRSTGGFITAYATFRVEKGVFHVEGSDDIYNLDNSVPKKPKAPRPILEYLPKVSTFNLRDSNISPDYVYSVNTFQDLFKQGGGKLDVDGVIALDTHVLVRTIKVLDDEVDAGGIKFTSKIDKRCDCPQVIYVLENEITRPVGYVKAARKDLLGTLLYAIMEKSLKSSPKLYWGPLFQEMANSVGEKHVLIYLTDKEAQKGVEALNAAGRIRDFDGDYLHINDTNFAGAKSNMYVKENVEENYQIGSDGSITKTITINYKNPYPPSDCNLERGGLCLNADLRNWLRVYVPKGSELVDSKGSEVKVISYEELGKTVFEAFFRVRPQGAATFTISYKLPFKPAKGSPLPVLIQKQPGTDKNPYEIKVNGRKKQSFDLSTDKELKLGI
ncbi:MAG: DUF4012 domain-containing protein [Patescibacteria group bacterium]|nr:DUF4012 domain-containing protein [Patescibacteria group bacterium]